MTQIYNRSFSLLQVHQLHALDRRPVDAHLLASREPVHCWKRLACLVLMDNTLNWQEYAKLGLQNYCIIMSTIIGRNLESKCSDLELGQTILRPNHHSQ